MENGHDSPSPYYLIVGRNTNTNEGLGRVLALIAASIVVLGTLFWILLR